MDGRGGCCIARYGGGGGSGGGGGYDMSTVDRIMLRFRPIAPKPANTGSTSPDIIGDVGSRSKRGRRRLIHGPTNRNSNYNKRCNNNRKRKASSEEKADTAVVTLPLLPETPDLLSPRQAKSVPKWLSFGGNGKSHHHDLRMISGATTTSLGMSVDHPTVTDPGIMRVVICSCLTVECVTDTWVDMEGSLGYTDEERRMNLERDTCPGFVSDGFGRVTWTNEAYKKMVGQGEADDGRERGAVEVVVWLVIKDKVTVTEAVGNNRAFTCRVRVQNESTCSNGKEGRPITLPCDVWRMDNGGFAWRLDVKAALSLGW